MKNEQSDKTKNLQTPQRERRYFSEAARRSIVSEIEQGLSKAEASRRYGVSQSSIYIWITKYSLHYRKTILTVAEHESDSIRLKRTEAKLKEAYEHLGRERAKNIFLEELIDTAQEALGVDLKKNFATKPS